MRKQERDAYLWGVCGIEGIRGIDVREGEEGGEIL